MLGKIKRFVREYLTEQYDALYKQELDEQTLVYDTWIRQKEKEDIIVEKHEREEEIIIFSENKNVISEDAVRKIQDIFSKKTEVCLVYTDEDEVNQNGKIRMNPWFKPDFSPDTLLSYFYFGSLAAVRKSVFINVFHNLQWKELEKELSLFPKEEKKKQLEQRIMAQGIVFLDYEEIGKELLYVIFLQFCLELKREQVFHIKKMLYTSHCIHYWGFEEKYKVIREYYAKKRPAVILDGVSIIIPSKDNSEILERCLKSIVHWTKDIMYEIIVVDNGSSLENKEKIEKLQREYGFSYQYEPMEFNFSRMCNKGAASANYSLLLFLNDDCEVRSSRWLSHMAALAKVQSTGAVGAKLYYPESKKIQHCGIYNIHLGPVHKLQFKEDIRPYYDRRNLGTRNVLAVTAACLMVKKSLFDIVEGFDEKLQVAFNDVDFCYRLWEAGYDNVVDNEIHLWHHESLSRGSDESTAKLARLMGEKKKLYEKHQALWEHDPYYHWGFSMDILDTGYSFDYEYPHRRELEVEVPVLMTNFPSGTREDACVVPMIEYAGDLQGWFLEKERVERIQKKMGSDQNAYLQGNIVVLGSNNACYEKSIILRGEENQKCFRIFPKQYYRPDVFSNLQDQKNVALSGFACFIDMSQMPKDRYEVGVLVKDKISGQYLLRVTARTIENR